MSRVRTGIGAIGSIFVALATIIPQAISGFPFQQEQVVLAEVSADRATQPRFASEPSSRILVQFAGEQTLSVLELPNGASASRVVLALRANPRVLFAEPDYPVTAAAASVTPDDSEFEKQSYHKQSRIPESWSLTTGSSEVVVAVLDSGVDINHPDLRSNIWVNGAETPGDGVDNDQNGYIDDINGWDFVDDIPDPTPKFHNAFIQAGIHHGTIIAGIIAARGNNGIGIAGVSWRSKIMPLRVLDNQGEGSVLSVINALDYAIRKKVDIVNLSFVSSGESQFLKAALKRAYDAGIIIVSATGNDNTKQHGFNLAEKPVYPACFTNEENEDIIVGVGSIDPIGQKAQFSNYGPCVDVVAPGYDYYATQVVKYDQPGFDAFYGSGWSGTSLSTAVVSGAFALMKSVNPLLHPVDAIRILKNSCNAVDKLNPSFTGGMGCGSLNVEKLIRNTIENGQIPRSTSENLTIQPHTLAVARADGSGPILFFEGTKRKANRQLFPFDPGRIPFSLSGSDGVSGIFAVGAGKGQSPFVRVYDRDLNNISAFTAYDKRFRGGVDVSVSDLDGDGEDEIITAAGSGGGPHVKVFDLFGSLRSQFFAYHGSFRGGLRVGSADLNRDGRSEIITTPITSAKSTRTEIRVFDDRGTLLSQFFAYPDTPVVTSIDFAVGDVDGDGTTEIVTSPLKEAGPVRVFSSTGILKQSFYAFPKQFRLPTQVMLGDLDRDGKDEIITAPARMAGPQIRMFDVSGKLLAEFFAFSKNTRTVLRLGIIR